MTLENLFGSFMALILKFADPYKKLFIQTQCKVHIFNNNQAFRLLRQYKYLEVYYLLKPYFKSINRGSVWADQSFKSTSHFYNPKTKRGMFGYSNALKLTEDYYEKALHYYIVKDYSKSMFYLGACVHIIQDLTIPQHVSIRLLDHHRSYENFVKYTYDLVKDYRSTDPPILLPDVKTYLEYNARLALKIDATYKKTHPLKMRFFKMSLSSLPLAQSTTAGCFILFVEDLKKYHDVMKERNIMWVKNGKLLEPLI